MLTIRCCMLVAPSLAPETILPSGMVITGRVWVAVLMVMYIQCFIIRTCFIPVVGLPMPAGTQQAAWPNGTVVTGRQYLRVISGMLFHLSIRLIIICLLLLRIME